MAGVRAATPADAEAACLAVRRSIVESCLADHRGESAVIDEWLANKTPRNLYGWIGSQEARSVVAERLGVVVGFALLRVEGEISLCYLVPEAQGAGLGRGMLAALEAEGVRDGLDEIRLRSTRTAHGFYLRSGFVDCGPPLAGRAIVVQPMRKRLASP